MTTILQKVFSYSGRMTRLEYLLYGLVLPIIMLGLGASLSTLGDIGNIIGTLFFIMGISITISSIVKRARDTNQNTTLVVVLFFLFTIIAVLIALIAPSRTGEKKEGSVVAIIVIVVFVIVILGILAAVAIPKFAAVQDKMQQEKSLEMEPTSSINYWRLHQA